MCLNLVWVMQAFVLMSPMIFDRKKQYFQNKKIYSIDRYTKNDFRNISFSSINKVQIVQKTYLWAILYELNLWIYERSLINLQEYRNKEKAFIDAYKISNFLSKPLETNVKSHGIIK